jgi:hypothetical protein
MKSVYSAVRYLKMIEYVLSLKSKYDFGNDLMTEAGRPEKLFYVLWLLCVTAKGKRYSLGGIDVKGILARFPERSLSALVLIQPCIQGILERISLEIKRPGREVNCSPPSNVKVKHLHSQCTLSWRGA